MYDIVYKLNIIMEDATTQINTVVPSEDIIKDEDIIKKLTVVEKAEKITQTQTLKLTIPKYVLYNIKNNKTTVNEQLYTFNLKITMKDNFLGKTILDAITKIINNYLHDIIKKQQENVTKYVKNFTEKEYVQKWHDEFRDFMEEYNKKLDKFKNYNIELNTEQNNHINTLKENLKKIIEYYKSNESNKNIKKIIIHNMNIIIFLLFNQIKIEFPTISNTFEPAQNFSGFKAVLDSSSGNKYKLLLTNPISNLEDATSYFNNMSSNYNNFKYNNKYKELLENNSNINLLEKISINSNELQIEEADKKPLEYHQYSTTHSNMDREKIINQLTGRKLEINMSISLKDFINNIYKFLYFNINNDVENDVSDKFDKFYGELKIKIKGTQSPSTTSLITVQPTESKINTKEIKTEITKKIKDLFKTVNQQYLIITNDNFIKSVGWNEDQVKEQLSSLQKYVQNKAINTINKILINHIFEADDSTDQQQCKQIENYSKLLEAYDENVKILEDVITKTNEENIITKISGNKYILNNTDYYHKYLKYKNKYLKLKNE